MSAASSSLISIATSSICNSKTLYLQSPIISISKTRFKTPKFSFNFKTHYLNFYPLLRSSFPSPNSSPSYEVIQVDENPESDPSAINEELENDDDEEVKEEEESEPESLAAREVYIGNFPYAITSSELYLVFGEAGNVVSVEIFYDRLTGRSKGFAFITMASVQEAQEAVRMFNRSRICGRKVTVNIRKGPRGIQRESSSNREFIESPHTIYAWNLDWSITSEKLEEAFANQPGLLSAKVIYENHSRMSRGFGYVSFSSPEAEDSALSAMNGVEVEGRPLRLNLAV